MTNTVGKLAHKVESQEKMADNSGKAYPAIPIYFLSACNRAGGGGERLPGYVFRSFCPGSYIHVCVEHWCSLFYEHIGLRCKPLLRDMTSWRPANAQCTYFACACVLFEIRHSSIHTGLESLRYHRMFFPPDVTLYFLALFLLRVLP